MQNPSDRIKKKFLITNILDEPLGYFKTNLEFEWLTILIPQESVWGLLLGKKKKKATQK